MASSAGSAIDNDGDTDYGSDFSPEEDQIVQRLLSGQAEKEDNPIVNDIEFEYHGINRSLRVPRVFGREERSALFEAARAAEQVADQISKSLKTTGYPDCKLSQEVVTNDSD